MTSEKIEPELTDEEFQRLSLIVKGDICMICWKPAKEEFKAYGDKFCSQACLDSAGRQLDSFGS